MSTANTISVSGQIRPPLPARTSFHDQTPFPSTIASLFNSLLFLAYSLFIFLAALHTAWTNFYGSYYTLRFTRG
ncbi:hypothetical protein AB1N83_003333 [Pleurotus pulmonarius]